MAPSATGPNATGTERFLVKPWSRPKPTVEELSVQSSIKSEIEQKYKKGGSEVK